MSEDFVYIEPAREHRQAFARWGLDQSPRLETASASGWNVPLVLYPSVPEGLLSGARVDGFPYRGVVEGKAPEGRGYKDAEPEPAPVVEPDGGAKPEPLTEPERKPQARRGRPRKAAGQ